jgi:Tol biopolymer transport system component
MFNNVKLEATLPFMFLLLLTSSFQVFTQTPEKKGLSPTDYFDFVFVSKPQISPDGTKIVFVKTTVNEDASGRHSHLYIIQNDQAPRRFTQGDSDKSPQW